MNALATLEWLETPEAELDAGAHVFQHVVQELATAFNEGRSGRLEEIVVPPPIL